MSATSPQPSVGKGIGLAVGLAVIELIMFTSLEQFIFLAMHEGAMMRGTLTTAMYKRGVRLTPRSKARNSTGKLMTHLSADISRIDTCAQFIHHAWASPLRLIVTVILCCVQIGPAGLVGFIAILLAVPAQAWIMKKAMSLRKRSMEYTEGRTKLFQGLLAAMSTIKMFTYEVPYMQRITELRRKEMGGIRNLAFIRSFNEAIAFSLPTIASVFAFVMYSALHRDMNLAVIFPALSYFNMMTAPLFLLPRAMSSITDALNASRRLATLFDSEVMEDTERVIDRNLGVALRVTNASFEWEEVADVSETAEATEPFAIRNLDLVIPHGQLIAIVGPVGSGKSSLLQGLLGEMRCTEGTVEFGGRLGYCQQTAWIQNATIRDNVLFGQKWDEDRYWRCIEEASLLPDLEILADGDLTEIGEKGVNLSGGQKQRVNIARGLYYGADILVGANVTRAVLTAAPRRSSQCRRRARRQGAVQRCDSGFAQCRQNRHPRDSRPPFPSPRRLYLHHGEWPDRRAGQLLRAGRSRRRVQEPHGRVRRPVRRYREGEQGHHRRRDDQGGRR